MRTILIATCVAIAGCGPSLVPGPQDTLLRSGEIVEGGEAWITLHPCSRTTPLVDSTWTPGRPSILALESALPQALKRLSWQRPGTGPERPLNGYDGRYAGYFSGGHRYIYGNFFTRGRPSDYPFIKNDSTVHFIYDQCGASRNHFGVIYNDSTHLIEKVEMNQRGIIYPSGWRFLIVDDSPTPRE
jgi:hypothetical protein